MNTGREVVPAVAPDECNSSLEDFPESPSAMKHSLLDLARIQRLIDPHCSQYGSSAGTSGVIALLRFHLLLIYRLFAVLRLVEPFARPALARRRRPRGATPVRLPNSSAKPFEFVAASCGKVCLFHGECLILIPQHSLYIECLPCSSSITPNLGSGHHRHRCSPMAGPFGLSLPSPGVGESSARARLASRTAVRCDFLSQFPRLTP
jgi:hypothetical protein